MGLDENSSNIEAWTEYVEKFKKLLETRADVQPIFNDVNLEKLSQKLNESYGGDSHN